MCFAVVYRAQDDVEYRYCAVSVDVSDKQRFYDNEKRGTPHIAESVLRFNEKLSCAVSRLARYCLSPQSFGLVKQHGYIEPLPILSPKLQDYVLDGFACDVRLH